MYSRGHGVKRKGFEVRGVRIAPGQVWIIQTPEVFGRWIPPGRVWVNVGSIGYPGPLTLK